MVKIRWTKKAEHHLAAIHEYISKDSMIYADKLINSLIKATIKLETMPFCGRRHPEFKNEIDVGIREIIQNNYRIFYIKPNNIIDILVVIHSSRDVKIDIIC